MDRGFSPNLMGNASIRRAVPNRWDLIAFPLIICFFVLFFAGYHQTLVPVTTLNTQVISLDPSMLPEYALRTILRFLVAMVFSVIFTFIYGALAAKSRRAGMVLIPVLDILQSVPVLGFLTFTVPFFVGLFPKQVLGVELASIFAIFTAQAWNMTFSFYQSLLTIPRDLEEVARSFHMSAWQKFWKLEVPFSMSGMIWNTMMSMSGSWFFIVAAEAISVGNNNYTLPGIGAYVAQAIAEKDMHAVLYVSIAMIIVVGLYDQLLFRPIVAWADKFRLESTSMIKAPTSWFLTLIRRARFFSFLISPISWVCRRLTEARFSFGFKINWPSSGKQTRLSVFIDRVWLVLVAGLTVYLAWYAYHYVRTVVSVHDIGHAFVLGFYSMIRVWSMVLILSIIWVPIGVWIGLRPKLAENIQGLVQFLAAFPANLLFPFCVYFIVKYSLNPNIWLTPLIALGSQWYILFNVIAGATSYPTDYREAASIFGVKGWQWWRKVILPGVFPYYITGVITAVGGAWNATLVAEVVQWGTKQIEAVGLGAYITDQTAAGVFPKVMLGISVMCVFVVFFNYVLWRPLYARAAEKLRLE